MGHCVLCTLYTVRYRCQKDTTDLKRYETSKKDDNNQFRYEFSSHHYLPFLSPNRLLFEIFTNKLKTLKPIEHSFASIEYST